MNMFNTRALIFSLIGTILVQYYNTGVANILNGHPHSDNWLAYFFILTLESPWPKSFVTRMKISYNTCAVNSKLDNHIFPHPFFNGHDSTSMTVPA